MKSHLQRSEYGIRDCIAKYYHRTNVTNSSTDDDDDDDDDSINYIYLNYSITHNSIAL